jgi:uncharacterized protein (DUF736 family)
MNETTNNANKQNNKKNEIGALWKKVSTSGSEYFSGYVNGEDGERVKVVAFENTYKKPSESTPDFRIFVSEVRQNNDASNAPVKNQQKPKPAKNNPPAETEIVEENSEDDIPF